mgnify:CR=1 FL=1
MMIGRVAEFASLEARHQGADARGRAVIDVGGKRGARLLPFMRLDGRIGDGDLPFDVAGREARQMLDALHPLARRLARLGVGIDQSEVGVWRKLPGAGD